MAGNQLLTSQKIVDRALAVLSETPTFLNMINTQYDDNFGYRGGAKVGDTVSVRVPQRATIRTGRIMDIAPIVDKVVPVKIDSYKGVDTGATSAEMAMQIDDFQEQYIDTKIPDLVAAVESDVMNRIIPQIPQTVGAYGAYNDAAIALAAGAYLDSQLAPKDGREMLINQYSQVDIIKSLSGFFNDQTKVGNQYKTGRMGTNTLGFDWDTTSYMPTVTRGTAAGYTVNGAGQSGSSLVVQAGTGTLNIGDTFTIAGVYDVHPQTKQALPGLKNFTVTAAYAGGAGTLQITPAIVGPGSSEQNVSALPASGAAITVKGTSGIAYAQNIAFSRDAFYFVTADLPNPPNSYGVDSATRTYKGITMRFQMGFDQVNDTFLSRFDIVYGAGVLRPELAVRIPSTVAFP